MATETLMQTSLTSEQLNTVEQVDLQPAASPASPASLAPASPPAVISHVLAGIDDDVEQDLAAIGISLAPEIERDLDDERRQAMAAVLLRRAGSVEGELRSVQRTMELEIAAITAHYERRMAPLRRSLSTFLDVVAELARLTVWRKRKSHETPYGAFGVKDKAATVKLVDPGAALAWARVERQDVVRVVVSLPLAEARQHFTDEEIARGGKVELEWGKLKATLSPGGMLPPGVEGVAAVREPFATPRGYFE